ncbi:hypothetical protein [Methylobacterium sp. ID0610]|uniref:hypothetical protein n=1 Tax=Methylobacterium carpenticola TaxID=3344827 RepID=UPI003691D7FC
MSRAISFRQRLASAVELSCSQGAAYVNAHKPLDVQATSVAITYPEMVKEITGRVFTAKGIATTPAPVTDNTDVNVHVEATRSQPLVFGSLLHQSALTFTAAKDCAVVSTVAARGNGLAPVMLFSESFEASHSVGSSAAGWDVLGGYNNNNTWNGWTTQGAGIEVDSQRAIAVSSVLFGSYFVELDSDCSTAANRGNRSCQSNSTISRIFNLTPGAYQVRYWYYSRLSDASIGSRVICGSKNSDVSY